LLVSVTTSPVSFSVVTVTSFTISPVGFSCVVSVTVTTSVYPFGSSSSFLFISGVTLVNLNNSEVNPFLAF
jgi:hypothetical protein